MKQKILLADDSLTVQKVVSLTVDKTRFQIYFAKSTAETLRAIGEYAPDCVLLSDTLSGITVSSFPKEVEMRLGREKKMPSMILISTQPMAGANHYAEILKKPFTPAALLAVLDHVLPETPQGVGQDLSAHAGEEEELQQTFQKTFGSEAELVAETFQGLNAISDSNTPADSTTAPLAIWDNNEGDTMPAMTPHPPASHHIHEANEKNVEQQLRPDLLDAMVSRVLDRIVPPIVERLVQERLDKLLTDEVPEMKA
jgi:DNA-binding response OmpR family regulator